MGAYIYIYVCVCVCVCVYLCMNITIHIHSPLVPSLVLSPSSVYTHIWFDSLHRSISVKMSYFIFSIETFTQKLVLIVSVLFL